MERNDCYESGGAGLSGTVEDYGRFARMLCSGSIGAMEEFGWSGALGTYLMMDPTYQLSVVFAEQSEPSHEPELHPRIRNLVYRSLED